MAIFPRETPVPPTLPRWESGSHHTAAQGRRVRIKIKTWVGQRLEGGKIYRVQEVLGVHTQGHRLLRQAARVLLLRNKNWWGSGWNPKRLAQGRYLPLRVRRVAWNLHLRTGSEMQHDRELLSNL